MNIRVLIPLLMGGILLGVAIFLIVRLSNETIDFFRFKDAIQIPIKKVVSLEKEATTGGNLIAGRYSLKVLYTYQLDGVVHEGYRTSIYKEKNLWNFQEDLFQNLKKCKEVGDVLNCFVDKNDYSSSVLDNRFRIKEFSTLTMFLIASLSVGSYLLYCAKYEHCQTAAARSGV